MTRSRTDGEVGERASDDDDPTYAVGTFTFTSPMHLPELTAHEGRPRFVRHRVRVPRVMGDDERRAFIDDEDARFLVVTRDDERVTFRFPRLALFTLERISEFVTIAHPISTPDDTVRHLLLDHVLPRLMVQAGTPCVHASVVVSPHGAIAFVGPSGAGKSTLATQLAARGWPILSDDALPIVNARDGLSTRPMYPGVRLFPENVHALLGDDVGESVAHYTDKRRLDARALSSAAFAKGTHKIARIFLLRRLPEDESSSGTPDGRADVDDNVVTIARPSSRDALLELLQSSFRLHIGDDDESARTFLQLSDPHLLALCRTLRAPHRHDVIEAVMAAIDKDLREGRVPS